MMRFIDNQNGTITDNETGLMWQQETMERKGWDKAILACSKLDLAGHSDWRLPTIEELTSIVDYGRKGPLRPSVPACYTRSACDPVFNAQSDHYWSSTTYQGSPYFAWVVYFYDGSTSAYTKTGYNYVRAVRAGKGN